MGDLGLPGGSVLKYLPANAGDTRDSSYKARSLGQEDPWRRKWQPTPVLLCGKPHGQGSLAGYSHGVTEELDTTEQLNNNRRLGSW